VVAENVEESERGFRRKETAVTRTLGEKKRDKTRDGFIIAIREMG